MNDNYNEKIKKLEQMKNENLITNEEYLNSKKILIEQFINDDNETSRNPKIESFPKEISYSKNINNNKKIISLILFLLISYFLFVFITYEVNINSASSSYDNKIYMVTSNELDSINNTIKFIPNFYKNTNEIRNEIDEVISIYRRLNIQSYGYTFNFREVNQLVMINVRNAYFDAVQFNSISRVFDLSHILDNPAPAILGREFENDNGTLYFRWTYEENQWKLSTNLPSDKISGKSYYYSYYNGIFRYGGVDDGDYFDAYSVSVIDENTLNIYCYSNDRSYQLKT